MLCKQCGSETPRMFMGELAIHFPGLAGVDKPIVWVFPELAICVHCGFAEFTVPERELLVLSTEKVVQNGGREQE